MSYSSRVYRQRNAHTHDEKNSDAFFGKQHDDDKTKSGNFFQDRLTVNKPNDAHEKEADAMASAVVNKSQAKPSVQQKNAGSVQRISSPAEDEKLSTNDARMKKDKDIQTKSENETDKEKKKPVQKKDDPEKEKKKPVQKMDDAGAEKEKKKPVQTKQEGNSGTASPALSSKIEGSSGKGTALPDKTLHEMNHAFGKDFSDVKIHNDSEAAEMNKELNAQAFTHGKDIYFNEGKLDTENTSGKNLLAHELTHVVQQNNK
jgi:hypothetical protein